MGNITPLKIQNGEIKQFQAGDTVDPAFTGVMPAGAIVMYGAAAAPSGYLLCDGSAVSRTTFAALFAIIGTTFGAGDGSTTFNVPNFRQRFPIGKAASGTGSTLGGTGGAIDHSHTVTTGTAAALLPVGVTTYAPAAQTITSSTNNPPFLTVNFIIKT